eukprot:39152-Eustigmatos_ZCMA.PRE.1
MAAGWLVHHAIRFFSFHLRNTCLPGPLFETDRQILCCVVKGAAILRFLGPVHALMRAEAEAAHPPTWLTALLDI